jgi:hypothetical protein
METFKGAVHRTEVYFAGMGSKDPALERFPNIKKKKKHYVYPPQPDLKTNLISVSMPFIHIL